jgi:hypothetical protein
MFHTRVGKPPDSWRRKRRHRTPLARVIHFSGINTRAATNPLGPAAEGCRTDRALGHMRFRSAAIGCGARRCIAGCLFRSRTAVFVPRNAVELFSWPADRAAANDASFELARRDAVRYAESSVWIQWSRGTEWHAEHRLSRNRRIISWHKHRALSATATGRRTARGRSALGWHSADCRRTGLDTLHAVFQLFRSRTASSRTVCALLQCSRGAIDALLPKRRTAASSASGTVLWSARAAASSAICAELPSDRAAGPSSVRAVFQ